jgi:glyoxylase-like metal-dependent hydrolase (beta-lactamase superfamily II)
VNEPSPAHTLGQGISLVTLPLPFRAPPSVNAYLIEGSDGFTMIDCGVDSVEGHLALIAGLADLGLDPAAIGVLIVSHLHPDHVGMAPRLVRDWGVRTVMHTRASKLVDRYNDTEGFIRRTKELADRHGVPPDARPAFVEVGERPAWMPPIDAPEQVVEDGDLIAIDSGRSLEVIHTPGHEPAHICLRDSRTGVLFAGDHVLPRITPFVGYDEMFDDVLADFLQSLLRVEDLRVTTTYPAHGAVIEHGSARAAQILLHHQRRLLGMLDVIDPGGTTSWQVMERVFRPHLSPSDQRLALRETVAHLEHLRLNQRLQSIEENGAIRYARPR